MVELTRSESALIDDVMECIRIAIEQSPEMDLQYSNKTKIQKLLYFAIEEYNLPISHSWYLAGAVVPDTSIGPGMLPDQGPKLDDVSRPSMGNTTSAGVEPESSTSPSDSIVDPILFGTTGGEPDKPNKSPEQLSKYVSTDELVEFYRSVAPTVWHEETMRFLQNFYQEKAPDRYRLLYIESTHLRTHLSEIADTIESHLEGEPPTRSLAQTREAVELSVSDFHYYIRQTDELRQTFEDVVNATDLIEEAVISLETVPPEELSEAHLDCVEQLQDFFFYYVWRYPALLISAETATGPQAEQLRREQLETYEEFDETLATAYTELEAELAEVGLRPSYEETHTVEDEALSETLTDLSSEYLK